MEVGRGRCLERKMGTRKGTPTGLFLCAGLRLTLVSIWRRRANRIPTSGAVTLPNIDAIHRHHKLIRDLMFLCTVN